MPVFKIVGGPSIWIPKGRLIYMEAGAGGLTTNVRALLVTPKGDALGTLEVEGRVEMLGAAVDAGQPTEVRQ